MPRSVSNPQFDRAKQCWVIRWVDDQGVKHASASHVDKTAAARFRAELLGQPLPGSDAAHVAKPLPPALRRKRRTSADPTEQAWSDELVYYRQAIRAAFDARDDLGLDLAAKAARAIGTLVTAHAQNRDVRALRKTIDELEQWRSSLTSAGTHGTRVDAAGEGGSPAGESVGSADSVH